MCQNSSTVDDINDDNCVCVCVLLKCIIKEFMTFTVSKGCWKFYKSLIVATWYAEQVGVSKKGEGDTK